MNHLVYCLRRHIVNDGALSLIRIHTDNYSRHAEQLPQNIAGVMFIFRYIGGG